MTALAIMLGYMLLLLVLGVVTQRLLRFTAGDYFLASRGIVERLAWWRLDRLFHAQFSRMFLPLMTTFFFALIVTSPSPITLMSTPFNTMVPSFFMVRLDLPVVRTISSPAVSWYFMPTVTVHSPSIPNRNLVNL